MQESFMGKDQGTTNKGEPVPARLACTETSCSAPEPTTRTAVAAGRVAKQTIAARGLLLESYKIARRHCNLLSA